MTTTTKAGAAARPWRQIEGEALRVYAGDVLVANCSTDFTGAQAGEITERHAVAKANAAYIVRAINAHEAMREALTNSLDALTGLKGYFDAESHEYDTIDHEIKRTIAALKLAGDA